MSAAETWLVPMVRESCCVCGVPFSMPADFNAKKRADGGSFYCPAGHQQHYTDTEVTKLKREIESQRKLTEWANQEARRHREAREHAENRVRAYKGHSTRIRKRIAKGKCPCCAKKFDDIERHILESHPGYVEEER